MRNGIAVLVTLSYPLLVYLTIGRVQPRYLALQRFLCQRVTLKNPQIRKM
jgi:hypothetical protein